MQKLSRKNLFFVNAIIAAILLTLAFLLTSSLSRAAGPAARGVWRFIPTLEVYLPLIKDHPAIGDAGHLLITEALYDPAVQQGGVEWIEIFNPTGEVIDLSEYKIGDEETIGGSEGMLAFPAGASIGVGRLILIAADALAFEQAYGFEPQYEFKESGSTVPDMIKYTAWAGGNVILTNSGDEILLLDLYDGLVDAVSWGNSDWAFYPDVPGVAKGHSIERFPGYVDSDSAADWVDRPVPTPGFTDLTPPTPTPTTGPTPTPFNGGLLISEVLYDPTQSEPGGEWIEIYNLTPGMLDISDFKIGDEETPGGSEGMYAFPSGSLISAGGVLVIANDAVLFETLYGQPPDYEISGADPAVPDLLKYAAWSGGSLSLSNAGDEVLLLDRLDNLVDAVSWGSSNWAFNPAVPSVSPGNSIERYPPGVDTDAAADWREQALPNPGFLPGFHLTPEP